LKIYDLLQKKNFNVLFDIFTVSQIIDFASEHNNTDILEYYVTHFKQLYYCQEFNKKFKKILLPEDLNNKTFYYHNFHNISQYIKSSSEEIIQNIIFYYILITPLFEYNSIFKDKTILDICSKNVNLQNILMHYNLITPPKNKLFDPNFLKNKIKNHARWVYPCVFFTIANINRLFLNFR